MEIAVDSRQISRYQGLEYPLVEKSAMHRRAVGGVKPEIKNLA